MRNILSSNDKSKYKMVIVSIVCFVFAFMLHFISIYNVDMAVSGDAYNAWQTITTFYSADMFPAPQLYKGTHCVYPYVWLYQLSQILGTEAFVFIKMYFALLFAFASAIGMPYIVSKLLNKKVNIIARILSILIIFWIWTPYGVFGTLWVDLPNFAYLTMAVATVIKFCETESFTKNVYIYAFLVGMICGIASGGSGQYSLTAYLLPLFTAIALSKKNSIKHYKSFLVPVICVLFIILGIMPFKLVDFYFEKTITQPFRDKGYWIPKELDRGLARSMTLFSFVRATPQLPDNRGEAILRVEFGDAAVNRDKDYYNENGYFPQKNVNGVQQGWQNTFRISYSGYLKLILKYPLDFMARFCNRFFWAANMDNGTSSFRRLFVGFTLLYLSMFSAFKHCKSLKSVFCPGILIIAAFVIPTLIPCFLHIEKRYAISLLSLVTCVGLFDDTLKNVWFSVRDKFRECVLKKSLMPLWNGKLSTSFVIYCVFMIFCFLHHATIMETLGPSVNILFSR